MREVGYSDFNTSKNPAAPLPQTMHWSPSESSKCYRHALRVATALCVGEVSERFVFRLKNQPTTFYDLRGRLNYGRFSGPLFMNIT